MTGDLGEQWPQRVPTVEERILTGEFHADALAACGISREAIAAGQTLFDPPLPLAERARRLLQVQQGASWTESEQLFRRLTQLNDFFSRNFVTDPNRFVRNQPAVVPFGIEANLWRYSGTVDNTVPHATFDCFSDVRAELERDPNAETMLGVTFRYSIPPKKRLVIDCIPHDGDRPLIIDTFGEPVAIDTKQVHIYPNALGYLVADELAVPPGETVGTVINADPIPLLRNQQGKLSLDLDELARQGTTARPYPHRKQLMYPHSQGEDVQLISTEARWTFKDSRYPGFHEFRTSTVVVHAPSDTPSEGGSYPVRVFVSGNTPFPKPLRFRLVKNNPNLAL